MSELIFMDLEWNSTWVYSQKEQKHVPFDELIEVAAMKVDRSSGAMLDSFHSYVHPARRIEGRTYRLLPYERDELRELLRTAPSFLDLGPAFIHWCGDSPVFVEWGGNDVEVLLKNLEHSGLSMDEGWQCRYFDLQYMYQKLCSEDMGCQPSLEKAVTSLDLDTDLDFHSAWNDTYYTVLVYQRMLDGFPDLQLFSRPPRQRGTPPLWEAELGVFDTRWACKNRREVSRPLCPICGAPLTQGRWVRTGPTEQVQRCRCQEHRRLYLAVTVDRAGRRWAGKASIYKDAGPVAERYNKTCRRLREEQGGQKSAPERGPKEKERALA